MADLKYNAATDQFVVTFDPSEGQPNTVYVIDCGLVEAIKRDSGYMAAIELVAAEMAKTA